MIINLSEIEKLLPLYLADELTADGRKKIDQWRNSSAENEKIFQQSLQAWAAIPLLQQMEEFNSFEALKKVNVRLSSGSTWKIYFQRIAVILLLPLLTYSGYLTIQTSEESDNEHTIMQAISARQGMINNFSLADGTKVWLNSGSTLYFPSIFHSDIREVQLEGEAFFEVAKKDDKPFRVNAKEFNIDVLGTSFNVVSYDDDDHFELVLVSGKVKLSLEEENRTTEIGIILPGQRAVLKENSNPIIENTEVDKYISWRDGNLMFRDDKMEDVVHRLSRWFNVEITIEDPELKAYIYTATFRNEDLNKVLELLKLSAPLDYMISDIKFMNDEFTKSKVYLMKRKV